MKSMMPAGAVPRKKKGPVKRSAKMKSPSLAKRQAMERMGQLAHFRKHSKGR